MKISLSIIGDGPLDEAMLPPIIGNILEVEVNSRFDAWKSLRVHGGYPGKLKYAIRRIIANGGDQGLVAVVDQDKDQKGDRIDQLKRAREDSRSLGVPTAVGRAIPHGEAWLLDDPEAVKTGLGLPAGARVPSPRRVGSPKYALTGLYQKNTRGLSTRKDAWRLIALEIQPNRCRTPSRTGYAEFVEDLTQELLILTRPE